MNAAVSGREIPAEQPMSWVDHAWLRMDSPTNLLVVNAVMWTAEPVDADGLRRLLAERLVGQFPRFAHRPADTSSPLGRARWVADEAFSIDRHLVEVTLAAPGDSRALQRYVGAQQEEPLDPDLPMWQVHLVHGYRDGSAVLFRVHHSIADGMALARVLLSLTDLAPPGGAEGEPVGFTEANPGGASLPSPLLGLPGLDTTWQVAAGLTQQGRDLLKDPRKAWALGRTALEDAARLLHVLDLPPKRASVLNQPLGVAKLATWTEPLPLAQVKAIGRAHGATVNDVLLAGLGGAFSRYLRERGEEPADVPVLIPVDLRPPGEPLPRELGNAFGFFFVDLPAGELGGGARVAEMHRRTEALKRSPEAVVTMGVLAGIGVAPAIVEDLAVAFFVTKVSGVVTNVPGPKEPVYVAGSRVDGVIGWVPRGGDISFGVAVFSYAGEVTVGFSTDAAVLPDPDRLVELFAEEMAALSQDPPS